MKYADENALFDAHFSDMVETFGGDSESMAHAATTLLVSILLTTYDGDSEEAIDALRHITEFVENSIDEGGVSLESVH